jgi:UTP--glucose-1-phosphate uridylyltransferase
MPKVRKAVIPAAGLGTRQYPASAAVAKEMFTLVDRDGLTKPVIQMILEEAVESGIEEICIITQPGDEKHYRDYFRRLNPAEATRFRGKDWAILQEGYGHAVYQAKTFCNGEPFLLMLGDHVYVSQTKDRCAKQVLSVFQEHDCDAVTGVMPSMERELHLFGTIRGRPIDADRGVYQAELIIEKPSIQVAREQLATPGFPAGNYLTHFGIHVFSSRIFDSLEALICGDAREKGEIQLTAAQEHLRAAHDKYLISLVRGRRCDTGIPYGLMETQLTLALYGTERVQICETIARILAEQNRV